MKRERELEREAVKRRDGGRRGKVREEREVVGNINEERSGEMRDK